VFYDRLFLSAGNVIDVVDMLLEALFFAASCLVIVVSAFKMRATAMKDRDKLRHPMNSLILVDQGGPFLRFFPFDWSWIYSKEGDETQE